MWWAFLGGLCRTSSRRARLALSPSRRSRRCAAVGSLRETGSTRSAPIVVGAVLVGLATLAAGLIYLGILAVTGEGVSSLPLAAGTTVASAVYTGCSRSIYPLARLCARATEKQGALGVW